jgi:malate permease and related proteins
VRVLIQTMLDVVLPVVLVIAVGAAVARAFDLDIRPVNRLAIYAMLPSLTFITMARMDFAAVPVACMMMGFLAYTAVMAAVAHVAGWRLRPLVRRSVVATSIFPNAANMMLPVALFAFGEAGLERALIYYVVSALLLFMLGPVILSGETRLGTLARRVLTFPVLWAAIAGLAVNASDAAVPAGVERALELMGAAAVPIVLLTLGVHVSRADRFVPRAVNWGAAALRLLAGPALALAVGSLAGLRALDLAILTLLGAMPAAVNCVVLALEFGGDADATGRTVIVSTLAALLTLPLVVAALGG